MKWELIWKLFAVGCEVLRWVTRRKPRRGVFLIVEDNANDAEILQHRLHKRGWRCEIASSGEAAAGLVKHTHYPIAFVDMRLPGMSGEALVRLLSRETPDTNIVVVCGEPCDLMKLPEDQSVVFMRKPPSLEALDDLLSKLKILNQ